MDLAKLDLCWTNQILQHIQQGVLLVQLPEDRTSLRLTYVNSKAKMLLELSADFAADDGTDMAVVDQRLGKGQLLNLCKAAIDEGLSGVERVYRLGKQGNEWAVKVTVIALDHCTGLVLLTDMANQCEQERELLAREAKFQLLVEKSKDCNCLHGQGACYQYLSPAVTTIMGYKPEELIGKAPQNFVHPGDATRMMSFLKKMRKGGEQGRIVARYLCKDGFYRWLETIVSPVCDYRQPEVCFQSSTRDVTEQKDLEERLRRMSYSDALTGLYNRGYFEEELHRLDRRRGGSVGIIIMDVDGLKFVNDALGHEAGDELLKATAQVLTGCFRTSDVIARIGGDEFAVLLDQVNMEHVRLAGQRIRMAVKQFNLGSVVTPLSLSLGYAVATGTDRGMTDLFKEADDFMYRDKLRHGKSVRSAIMQTLKKLLKEHDCNPNHVERCTELVVLFGEVLGLDTEKIEELVLFAQFHDIGKVGIPDLLLDNSNHYNETERAAMQRHCEIGHRIALALPELKGIADWIWKHHEWWDGNGYPLGLSGSDIPLESRMIAIVDAYDAITSGRPYRAAGSHDQALDELRRYAGTQFDPNLVKIFVTIDWDSVLQLPKGGLIEGMT